MSSQVADDQASVRAARLRRRGVVSALVIVVAFSFVAMRDLEGLLRGMHVAADPPAGVFDLVEPGQLGRVDHTRTVLRDWQEYEKSPDRRQDTASPDVVAGIALGIDAIFFVPAYAVLILLLLDTFRARPLGVAPGAVRIIRPLSFVLIALVVFDELENVLSGLVVWRGPDEVTGWLVGPLWAAFVCKLLAILLLAVPIVFLLWWRLVDWWQTGAEARGLVFEALKRLRVHILLVAAYAALLFGHEQIPDLFRRWTWLPLVLTVVLGVLLAVVLWLSAQRLMATGEQDHGDRWATADLGSRTAPFPAGVVAIGALAVVLAVFTVRWATGGATGWGLAVLAGLVCVLALVSSVTGRRPAHTSDFGCNHAFGLVVGRFLAAAVLVILGLALFRASFAYGVYVRGWDGLLILWLGLFTGGAALATFLILRGFATRAERAWRIVFVVVIVAGVGAVVALSLLHPDEPALQTELLVATAVFLGAGGWVFHHAFSGAEPARDRTFWGFVWAAILASVGLLVATIVEPWATGEHLGGVAIVTGFCLAVTLIGLALVGIFDRYAPPAPLQALALKRIPIVTILLVWLIAVSLIDAKGSHEIRSRPAGDKPYPAITLTSAWHCWLDKNRLGEEQSLCAQTASGTPAADEATPLIVVATSGGGIRAAYWTALVLDCAFEVDLTADETLVDKLLPCPQGADVPRRATLDRSNALFAVSGISGGSLGLAAYAAYLTETPRPGGEWIEQRLDADSLSASLAWWLFVETPQSFLRFDAGMDRARVLEAGWEQDWASPGEVESDEGLAQGLFSLWHEHPEAPLLLLNGTTVAEACRFNASVLNANVIDENRLKRASSCRSLESFDEDKQDDVHDDSFNPVDPAVEPVSDDAALSSTVDLADLLCVGEDEQREVSLATAALLSGRFPFVSPAGRVKSKCGQETEFSVVDGGYLETSGASPIVELSDQLFPLVEQFNQQEAGTRCVVPFLIQVENGGSEAATEPPRRVSELLVPLTTVFAARHGRAANAREAAALLFTDSFGDASGSSGYADRYARFTNEAHAGPQAPLGWTLSPESRQDLVRQLKNPRNRRAFAEVRTWFEAAANGSLTCPPVSQQAADQ